MEDTFLDCNQEQPLEDLDSSSTPICDFYRDATVLITGGTGFIGKVLIQKLLRAFRIKKIYMLIRSKNDLNANQRLEKFFQESIFDKIREDCPELFSKVQPINADFSSLDLAILPADRDLLRNEVEIVFNVVASVKFNEKLSDAIDINVLGTKKILDLVMEMRHLKSFVHISTLYCNCNLKFIKEQVYDNEIGYEKIMQIYRVVDDKTLEKIRHCLIGDMPNTYTMTKKCAENLVNHQAFFLPAGIFRPPIVMSTYKEPLPGWTDNLYGPSGVCTWSARGLVRCIHGRAGCKANLVPADYCVNAMIACAWDVARRFQIRKCERTEIPVYNYIFSGNNLTWGQYMHLARRGFHEPFDKALWCFSYFIIPSKPVHRILTFLLHNVPGYILDLIAMTTGQKKIYTKSYRKIAKVIDMMSWFGLKEWKFANGNIVELDRILKDDERTILPFNLGSINWPEYFHSYLSGVRRYFFKDTEDELKQRKKIYGRIWLVHILMKTTFGLTLIMSIMKYFMKILNLIPRMNF
ncbi:fatty acyl-CoA reductase wat [Episyrphus balteatus]|uniref:fatty acyl-CoA reductase wat n=1 Tax=Episyrphus balteatus TaxID=286459 RepID=UPI002485725B|nr:fatty acyl-CoA reductase wat [Episyrphus balteatus]